MTRSPYGPAFGRADSGPGDAAAELETDVMRFMAILSLCLVAIFALVKSLPVGPAPAPADIEAPAPRPVQAPKPPDAAVIERPKQQPSKAPAPPDAAAIERPKQEAPRAEPPPAAPATQERTAPAPASTAAQPAAPAAAKGFVLQFENDRALTRLVERDAVGLYALSAGSAHRLKAEAGRMSFWPAAVPEAFHEMDPATVPAEVLRALAAAGIVDSKAEWGVTLPPATSAELTRLLKVAPGGTLVIDARGELRLEP